MARKRISRKLEKQVFQEAGNACPFCGEGNVLSLLIHHIKPLAEGGKDELPNLILVCGNCHGKIHGEDISTKEVVEKKRSLQLGAGRQKALPKVVSQQLSVNDSINFGVIGNNITIANRNRRPVKISPPPGSIASELFKRNYVKYLIDRYIEFKNEDRTVGKFRPVIYKSIQRTFGSKWDMVPCERFDEVVKYVQERIDQTILGKNNRSTGQGNYSTFQEYIDKHC